MSDRLTTRWKGTEEKSVLESMGAYSNKIPKPEGYALRYDYSYAIITNHSIPLKDPKGLQIKAGTDRSANSITPRAEPGIPTYRENATRPDSVIKSIDFYFDKTKHVKYVYAEGYPDSVFYTKRN